MDVDGTGNNDNVQVVPLAGGYRVNGLSTLITVNGVAADKDLLFNAVFNRSGIHNQLNEALFKIYGNLPCVTPDEWSRCQQTAQEMQDHLADAIEEPASPTPGHTTHFSIIDRWGNAVVMTSTIRTSFGTGITVPG